MAEGIEKRMGELLDAKTGEKMEELPANPIEEARLLSLDLKKDIAEMKKLKAEVEKSSAYLMLAGRSQVGQAPKEKTQEEIDDEQAKALANRFIRR